MPITLYRGLSKLNKRNLVLTAAALIALSAVVFVLVPVIASAGIWDTFMEGIKEIIDSCFTDWGEVVYDTVFTNPLWDDVINGSTFVSGVISVISVVSGGLFVTYLLVNVVQEASKGELTLDFFLSLFVRAVICMMILYNLTTILNAFHGMFKYVGQGIQDAMRTLQKSPNFQDSIDKLSSWSSSDNFLEKLLAVLNYLAILIATVLTRAVTGIIWLLLKFAVMVMSYKLILELLIRRVFMPVALLGIMTEGPRNPGFNYLKKFFACYIKVFIYMLALGVGEYLASFAFTEWSAEEPIGIALEVLSFTMQYAVYEIAALTFANKSEKLCEEILGIA